jgi:MFS superfamily sulfate permease-like transporter
MVGVTEIALFERLQRALRRQGKFLNVADSKKQKRWGLGRYYIAGLNVIVDQDVNIEKLAREMNVLEPWETLEK